MYCNKCEKKVNIINNKLFCITCAFMNEIKTKNICNNCNKLISKKNNLYYKNDKMYCSNLCRKLFKN